MNQQQTMAPPSEPNEMGLLDHLGELRWRLVISLASVLVLALVSYSFSGQIFKILCAPYYEAFPQSWLIGTGPAEAFILKIKIALVGGLVLSLPVISYQLWLFIAPGLYAQERKYVVPFVTFSTLLFLIGAYFCYSIVFPFAFRFFYGEYQSIGVTPAVKLSEHLSTVVSGMLAFGLIFELPVLAFFLARLGVIDHTFLIKGIRHAIVIIFIVAAVLTPPDVVTQFLMAGPLLLLYGISILIARIFAVKKQAKNFASSGTNL